MTFARVRALVLVGFLVVAAAVVAAVVIGQDSQRGAASAGCPADWPRADMTLHGTRDIVVAVFNGGSRSGTAAAVAGDFRNRDFHVRPLREPAKQERVKGVAVLRYGPEAVGAAHVVRAYFLGKATLDYDAARRGAQVDVVVGEKFQSLAQPTDVNIALADMGHPKVPPGTCVRDA
jgi:LytR cell envelope-related transcriptional attenuator